VLYGGAPSPASAWPLALRAVRLSGGGLEAWAEDGPFLRAFGLAPVAEDD
jgi:hypothetical protein